jgi:hypothetical protein
MGEWKEGSKEVAFEWWLIILNSYSSSSLLVAIFAHLIFKWFLSTIPRSLSLPSPTRI